jgi:dTDP-4-dehydrorhamnose reductase
MRPLELWGGHECSLIRTHDSYTDQTVLQGHEHRLGDLHLFAELGLKVLRYPVLWERVSPGDPDERDWRWSDERLRELKRIGIRPLVGLTHHGSGPRHTNLLDEGFAPGLAAHARAVAERYPWVEEWNPVNEPLTTARFSALYGVWYPHHRRDEAGFWLALINQVNAVRLSMKEVRAVNPAARLIQTDDLGFTHATPQMAEQAEFENHRRWASWDLLFGRVVPGHPLWARIAGHGHHRRLAEIADDPCPPDMIGANYYVAGERLIDHRPENYPGMVGMDGPGDYANADAARSVERPLLGIEALLDQLWERYRCPIGITETHNVGTRDEQMRWFLEIWRSAETLRGRGVRVEAIAAWSLLGAFDWKTLGVEKKDRYECGIFDLVSGEPRPTALVAMLRALAAGEPPPRNVALASPGWWRREVRFKHDTEGRDLKAVGTLVELPGHIPQSPAPTIDSAPILITGATGLLGREFARACERRALPHVLTDRAALNLEDRVSIDEAIRKHRPASVINAAGWSSIDGAEAHPDRCFAANALGPENLGRACRMAEIPLVHISSDMVFGGDKGAPYLEWDETCPVNTYGRSKAEGERRVLSTGADVLLVRSATFFSPHNANNFAISLLRELQNGKSPSAVADRFMSPTYLPDLVDAVLDLLIDGEVGIWHLANSDRTSWAELSRLLAETAGYDPDAIVEVTAETRWTARRPVDVTLGSVRGCQLSEVEPAVQRFANDTRLVSVGRPPQPNAGERDPILVVAAE